MYRLTVDDGRSIFDMDVEDSELPKEMDRLLIEEGHSKVTAERITDAD